MVKKKKVWMYSSFILGLLLIVSVVTNGFKFGISIDSVVSDLNHLNSKDNSPQVKSAITGAIVALENMDSNQPSEAKGSAKIIIEEFSDFECPFCGRAFPTVERILEEYGDNIQFVYKHFPLSFHPNAQKAAEASECARDQGKFKAYHDKLFQNQGALQINDLKRYANELGLNTAEFNSCLNNNEKASKVQSEFQEGQQKGVSGTPTFFINGQKLVGAQPYENFKTVIDAQLAGAPSQPAQPTEPSAPAPSAEVETSIDDDPVKGSKDAKVVIVEFSDFQCPFCGRFYAQTLPSITSEYIDTGKVMFVYRDFPLTSIHPQAAPAAEAAECANEQGEFWEFHDLIFDNQGSLSIDNYKKWASELDLNTEQFNDCVDSRKYQSEVAQDLSDGSAAGVRGTPGFVVGVLQDDGTVVGQSIRGAQPFANFKAVIDAELAKV